METENTRYGAAGSGHVSGDGSGQLKRVFAKPRLEDWNDDEPLTLVEAAALDVSNGKLTLKGLRTAVNNKEIASARVSGKIWISKAAVKAAFAMTVDPARTLPMPVTDVPAPKKAISTKSLVLAKIASERNASAGRRLKDLS